MSTVAYGAITGRRKRSGSSNTTEAEPPGIDTWGDSFTALVPGEVLLVHAVVMQQLTDDNEITNKTGVLVWLGILLVLCVGLYILGQYAQKPGTRLWDNADYGRVIMVLLAFGGWMLAQKPSALDAVPYTKVLSSDTRAILVVVCALIVGLVSKFVFGVKADQVSY